MGESETPFPTALLNQNGHQLRKRYYKEQLTMAIDTSNTQLMGQSFYTKYHWHMEDKSR